MLPGNPTWNLKSGKHIRFLPTQGCYFNWRADSQGSHNIYPLKTFYRVFILQVIVASVTCNFSEGSIHIYSVITWFFEEKSKQGVLSITECSFGKTRLNFFGKFCSFNYFCTRISHALSAMHFLYGSNAVVCHDCLPKPTTNLIGNHFDRDGRRPWWDSNLPPACRTHAITHTTTGGHAVQEN